MIKLRIGVNVTSKFSTNDKIRLLKNHARLKTITAQVYTRFLAGKAQTHTVWGGTFLYNLSCEVLYHICRMISCG